MSKSTIGREIIFAAKILSLISIGQSSNISDAGIVLPPAVLTAIPESNSRIGKHIYLPNFGDIKECVDPESNKVYAFIKQIDTIPFTTSFEGSIAAAKERCSTLGCYSLPSSFLFDLGQLFT